VLRRLVRDTLAVPSSDPSAKHTVFAGMVELQQGCELYE
jgi:hypothetical protein